MRATWFLLLGGCFQPVPTAGAPCSALGECPDGLDCRPTPSGDRCLEPGAVDDAATEASEVDASVIDAADDAAPDAPTCTPTVLLAGGTSAIQQGWSIATNGNGGAIQYNVDHTKVVGGGGNDNASFMITRTGISPPFAIDFVLEVEDVARPHDPTGAGVAIMGAIRLAPTGNQPDRDQSIFLDNSTVGFVGGGPIYTVNTKNRHTYRFAVTTGGIASLHVDGIPVLTRSNYVANGTIAIGDQTGADEIDGRVRIFSITRACP